MAQRSCTKQAMISRNKVEKDNEHSPYLQSLLTSKGKKCPQKIPPSQNISLLSLAPPKIPSRKLPPKLPKKLSRISHSRQSPPKYLCRKKPPPGDAPPLTDSERPLSLSLSVIDNLPRKSLPWQWKLSPRKDFSHAPKNISNRPPLPKITCSCLKSPSPLPCSWQQKSILSSYAPPSLH